MDRLLMNDITHDKRARISRIHKNERVIIIAPVGQDAAAMATLLDTQGFETQICNGSAEYSRQIADCAGALLLTEEALESAQSSLLLDVLKAQPPWSELPLIILTSGGESRRCCMKTYGNCWSRRGCNLPRCAKRKTPANENRLLAKLPMYLSVRFS